MDFTKMNTKLKMSILLNMLPIRKTVKMLKVATYTFTQLLLYLFSQQMGLYSLPERLPNVTNVPKTQWSHNLISFKFNQVKTF